MSTDLHRKPEYQKFRVIPLSLRRRMLELRKRMDVAITPIALSAHGSGKTWRLRWHESVDGKDRHYSISVGCDPIIISAVQEVLDLWKKDEFPLYCLAYPRAYRIPNEYHGGWLELRGPKPATGKRRPAYSANASLHRQPVTDQQDRGILDIERRMPTGDIPPELEKYRRLPTDLIYELFQLMKRVNVRTCKLHVVQRPDRHTYCLRWRGTKGRGDMVHCSTSLGKDPSIAATVKQLIIDWRIGKTPLHDLLFAGQVVPPDYWGIDWTERMQHAPQICSTVASQVEPAQMKSPPENQEVDRGKQAPAATHAEPCGEKVLMSPDIPEVYGRKPKDFYGERYGTYRVPLHRSLHHPGFVRCK